MLILDGDVGGSLSLDDVKPLYDAGFKGNSLDNIVHEIKENGKSKAVESMKEDYVTVPSSTCRTVVNWVNDTLLPKIFTLWNKDQTKDALCQSKVKGGAGLKMGQVQPLHDEDFDGTSLSNMINLIEKAQQSGNELCK